MLDMGFQDDLMEIITELPKEKQTLLFSATYTEEIKKNKPSITKTTQLK